MVDKICGESCFRKIVLKREGEIERKKSKREVKDYPEELSK